MKSGCEDQQAKRLGLPQRGMRKSKTSRWRGAALLLLNLFMIAHVIQWRITGRTVSPIEPSETMHTLQRGAINAGFIFFALAILATMIFGRFVCGWGCHILALQDFCGWMLKKIGLTPKPFRSRLLVYVPLIGALYMFVWPTAYRFFANPDHGPLIPKFTNHLVTTNFWETFPSVAVAVPFLFICGFMTVYFLGQKGFCTYACPYGGFFGLADKFSPGKIRVTDALYFGFGKPTLFVPKSNAIKKSYSVTWPEEIVGVIVFLGSFLAVRGVYALVPFLMALGCATITTFLTVKAWRLLKAKELSFYRFNLKSSGRIRKAGWGFVIFAVVWIGLTAHSGWVRYHEYLGDRAFQKIQIPDELALAQMNPARWLSPIDRENILEGKKHLQATANFGLFANSETLSKLAWFEYLYGDAEQSVALLSRAAARQTGQGKALSLYYRGTILNRLGRYEQARTSLDESLAQRADLILARQEKGESLWQLGRKEEAISVWSDAVQRNTRLVLANNQLAAAERYPGRFEQALPNEREADRFNPDNPLYIG